MNSKDILKIGAALVIIGAAVGLFVVRSRATSEQDGAAEGEVSHFYCVKAKKFFELHGEELDGRQKMVALKDVPQPEGAAARSGKLKGLGTVAKSPYTDDWTGIPAEKCRQCGEVFVLDISVESVCPKCKWNPSQKGAAPRTGG